MAKGRRDSDRRSGPERVRTLPDQDDGGLARGWGSQGPEGPTAPEREEWRPSAFCPPGPPHKASGSSPHCSEQASSALKHFPSSLPQTHRHRPHLTGPHPDSTHPPARSPASLRSPTAARPCCSISVCSPAATLPLPKSLAEYHNLRGTRSEISSEAQQMKDGIYAQ